MAQSDVMYELLGYKLNNLFRDGKASFICLDNTLVEVKNKNDCKGQYMVDSCYRI